MALPNFIVAGFAKCGTTSLYHYLIEHPEIYLPERKELHYFTYDSILKSRCLGPGDKEMHSFHVKTFDDYKKFYSNSDGYKAIGDISPTYASYMEGLEGLKSVLGSSTKVVLIVRDPIDRMYSNYLHLVREGRETLSFEDAIANEDKRFFEKGFSNFWRYKFTSSYYSKIKNVTDNFENVFILTFEDFVRNRKKRLKELYSFLGVDENFVPDNIDYQFNQGGLYKSNFITKLIFHRGKINSFLKKIIPLNATTKKIASKVTRSSKIETPRINNETELVLIKQFREEVSALKRDFGVHTEFWTRFDRER